MEEAPLSSAPKSHTQRKKSKAGAVADQHHMCVYYVHNVCIIHNQGNDYRVENTMSLKLSSHDKGAAALMKGCEQREHVSFPIHYHIICII